MNHIDTEKKKEKPEEKTKDEMYKSSTCVSRSREAAELCWPNCGVYVRRPPDSVSEYWTMSGRSSVHFLVLSNKFCVTCWRIYETANDGLNGLRLADELRNHERVELHFHSPSFAAVVLAVCSGCVWLHYVASTWRTARNTSILCVCVCVCDGNLNGNRPTDVFLRLFQSSYKYNVSWWYCPTRKSEVKWIGKSC